jgi:hypothetical protein
MVGKHRLDVEESGWTIIVVTQPPLVARLLVAITIAGELACRCTRRT